MVLLLCGCGGDDDDSGVDVCGVEEPLPGTSLEELGKLASISVQEKEDDGGPIVRFATAAFFDFTNFDVDAPPTTNFDLVCSTVVGEQVGDPPEALQSPESATITVDSDAVDFVELDPGRMRADDLAALSRGSVVAVDVQGGDGEDEFPSFETEVESSDAPLELTSELQPTGELVLRWAPSGAEAVEVEIWVLDPEPIFHPIRCVVADDGCLTVSSDAAGFVFRGVEPAPLDIRVASVRSGQWDGPDGEVGFLKIERRRDIAFTP